MSTYHIALAANADYFQYVAVVAHSIAMTQKNDGLHNWHIHLITDQWTEESGAIFSFLKSFKHIRFGVHDIDTSIYKAFNHPRFTYYTNLRMHLSEILHDVNRVLYLDVDTLVMGDLIPLMDYNMKGKAFALVPEPDIVKNNYLVEHSIPFSNYYNAGVMLIDLARVRKTNYAQLFYQYLSSHYNELHCVDQDTINVLFQDDIVTLPIEYNIMINHLHSQVLYTPLRKAELKNALFHPKIVHYAACAPWYKEMRKHPYYYAWIARAKQLDFTITRKYKYSLKQRMIEKIYRLYRFIIGKSLPKHKTFGLQELQARFNSIPG